MSNASLTARVDRLKTLLDAFALNSDHNIEIEKVSPDEIQRLQKIEGLPQDILMILSKIGAMRRWEYMDHSMIQWWPPCPISQATTDGRCTYVSKEENVKNGAGLLFFAWDCNPDLYFYDTKFTPFKLLSADGMFIISEYDEDPGATPANASDILSVIERWTAHALRTL